MRMRSMINQIHARLHRPETGWDPVPADHVRTYAQVEWSQGAREDLLDELDRWVGGLAGKRVLDLGGGPGQYSVAFAKREAQVTWYDISRMYREIAEERAREHGVQLQFALGYLDEAAKRLGAQFDLVFNRICWNYGWHDASFAQVLFGLVRPGGVGYVDTTHSDWHRDTLSLSAAVRNWLNETLAIKIGHPFPPHGRLAALFSRMPVDRILVDYSLATNDRILFARSMDS
jgi:2-polyprenyl-3-methyl-5-hydroxy-6-metoxy-1,4-benzoquinol methylase